MTDRASGSAPAVPTTIPAVVARAAREFGSLEALVDERGRITFAELADAALTSARALIASGVEPGDRVAIWAPNTTEWVHAALGVYAAGAVIVPLNTRFKGREAADILQRSGARTLFCVNGFLGNDYPALLADPLAAGELPDLRSIVVLRGEAPAATQGWADFLAGAATVTPAQARERSSQISADDLSDLIFTSGTTGRPKVAM